MDAGVDGNNTRHDVNVSILSKELGPDLCTALPGIHSFAGCDYTVAFLWKGKVCRLKLMEKSNIASHLDKLRGAIQVHCCLPVQYM